MTTKQGIAYIKNKNNKNKLIEANTQRRAAPTSELEKQAPVSYREIVDKNMQHVNDALVNCNNFCDQKYSDTERNSCKFGCEIKGQAEEGTEAEIKKKIRMYVTESYLDGLGLVDDFDLKLDAVLEAKLSGLEGEALLGVTVSQPQLLRLIPPKILESTGQSILNGILLGIKARVQKQLIVDFNNWCNEN